MNIIQELLKNIPLPRMAKVRQHFPGDCIEDLPSAVKDAFAAQGVGDTILSGKQIAIAVGSRGISNIATVVRETASQIRRRGASPFVVPAMGSHGGATGSGQKEILESLGVTEGFVGCPIRASMEVVELGRLENGLVVLIDKTAYEADGIVVINRVKPHTAFRGPSESGLVKMITIGLGKQKGADACHTYGFGHMARFIIDMTKITLAKAPILFGIALVENAYDQTAKVVGVPAREIIETDRKLLVEAKANMPRILFDKIDVLVVDFIGKEYSGDGMDPNITGRYSTPFATGGPDINKIVVFDLTVNTHGNANGIGVADFTTRRLVDKIDFPAMYANAFTSTITVPARLPVIMENDRDALCAAIKTCNAHDMKKVKLVRIHNTLHLGEIQISEALLADAVAMDSMTVCSEPQELQFDGAGNLVGLKQGR